MTQTDFDIDAYEAAIEAKQKADAEATESLGVDEAIEAPMDEVGAQIRLAKLDGMDEQRREIISYAFENGLSFKTEHGNELFLRAIDALRALEYIDYLNDVTGEVDMPEPMREKLERIGVKFPEQVKAEAAEKWDRENPVTEPGEKPKTRRGGRPTPRAKAEKKDITDDLLKAITDNPGQSKAFFEAKDRGLGGATPVRAAMKALLEAGDIEVRPEGRRTSIYPTSSN